VLDLRIMPAIYWQPPADPPPASADWNVAGNWSGNVIPGNTDDVIFDSTRSTVPCVVSAMVPSTQSISFAANLPTGSTSYVLTVAANNTLTTDTLTINARSGCGNEILIQQSAKINVIGTFDFGGGDVQGSGVLAVNGTDEDSGEVHIRGTSQVDPPTLQADLVLNDLDTAGGVTMDFAGSAVQPLVVWNRGAIEVCNNATLSFDNLPLPGNNVATAIRNGDGGTESIYVDPGGTVVAGGDCPRIVGMGVKLYADGGDSTADVNVLGAQPLEFGGKTISGYGLDTSGGVVNVDGPLIIDNGANLHGGNVTVFSKLVLGTPDAPTLSQLYTGATLYVPGGTLIFHGDFDMGGGVLDTRGSETATVMLDSGRQFNFSGGIIQITDDNAQGMLTINGSFAATGGFIQIGLDTATGEWGELQINGEAQFNDSCTVFVYDLAMPPIYSSDLAWPVITWSSGGGTLSVYAPWQWTYQWAAGELDLYEPQPNPPLP
jgi:hypothetical protein